MNRKQYEDAHKVARLCRIFADNMSRYLRETSLWELGYGVRVSIDTYLDNGERTDLRTVRLTKSPAETDLDEWWKSQVTQQYSNCDGWRIEYDPYAERKTLPENARFPEDRDERTGMAKDADHPYPPDGLWISAYDDPPVLDGGM